MNALCCTSCGEVVIKTSGADTKIRSKVLVVKSTGVFAACKGCGKDIQMPLKVDTLMMKSMSDSKNLKIFINK